ncbi:unnamed protein product [Effrenium voratum]|nr:unnamed protein product [Effrenium voratum]
MPSSRSDLTATTVGDGIYLIGGCANDQEWSVGADMYLCSGLTKKVDKYLPASDSFEALTDAPRTRYRHTAAAVGSQIFVFGGCDISDAIVTEVDVLDTQTGQWSTLSTSMPNATSDLSSFVSGGKVYLLGGLQPAQLRRPGQGPGLRPRPKRRIGLERRTSPDPGPGRRGLSGGWGRGLCARRLPPQQLVLSHGPPGGHVPFQPLRRLEGARCHERGPGRQGGGGFERQAPRRGGRVQEPGWPLYAPHGRGGL